MNVVTSTLHVEKTDVKMQNKSTEAPQEGF